MSLRKTKIILNSAAIVFLGFLAAGFSCCYAVSGARPVSMGEAFVAVSDDVHAVTWNPAGLAWQLQPEITYSGIFVKRGEYINGDFFSDDHVAYAQPFTPSYRGDYDKRGGWGLSFQNYYNEDNSTRAKLTLWQPSFAYGRAFSFNETMSWGVGLNAYFYDSEIPGATSNDEALSLSFGYLWYVTNNLSIGLLVENINEPRIGLHGVTSRLVRNWRPGIAYYIGDTTILSMEIYDLTGNTKDKGADYSQNLRFGFEQFITKTVSFRLGAHNVNSEEEASRYFSFGLGWLHSDFLNAQPTTYYLDYTLVYWPEAVKGTEEFTHMAGITIKF